MYPTHFANNAKGMGHGEIPAGIREGGLGLG
jgi:hypothetical protein